MQCQEGGQFLRLTLALQLTLTLGAAIGQYQWSQLEGAPREVIAGTLDALAIRVPIADAERMGVTRVDLERQPNLVRRSSPCLGGVRRRALLHEALEHDAIEDRLA